MKLLGLFWLGLLFWLRLLFRRLRLRLLLVLFLNEILREWTSAYAPEFQLMMTLLKIIENKYYYNIVYNNN